MPARASTRARCTACGAVATTTASTLSPASNTGTPSPANSLAVSLLPMPIEPVRPITNGFLLPLTQHLYQRGPQRRRDLGADAEESLERRHRLVHQHAQPVDGPVAARSGVFQQFGFQGIVNDVANR